MHILPFRILPFFEPSWHVLPVEFHINICQGRHSLAVVTSVKYELSFEYLINTSTDKIAIISNEVINERSSVSPRYK